MEGKVIRLSRLFGGSPRLLIVPMDHGVTLGAVGGLRNIKSVVRAVTAGGANAVVVHKGIAAEIAGELSAEPHAELIVHLSASTRLAPDPNRKVLVSSVEQALQLGATAVSVHVNLGSAAEPKMLRDLGRVGEECRRWGTPLLAMMYVRDGNPAHEHDPERLAHAARVAEELGADLVKVNYTGAPDTFAGVVSGVRIPVVIAGGAKTSEVTEFLAAVHGAVRAGARGVAIGRNIFEDPDPRNLTALVRQVLDGADPSAEPARG